MLPASTLQHGTLVNIASEREIVSSAGRPRAYRGACRYGHVPRFAPAALALRLLLTADSRADLSGRGAALHRADSID